MCVFNSYIKCHCGNKSLAIIYANIQKKNIKKMYANELLTSLKWWHVKVANFVFHLTYSLHVAKCNGWCTCESRDGNKFFYRRQHYDSYQSLDLLVFSLNRLSWSEAVNKSTMLIINKKTANFFIKIKISFVDWKFRVSMSRYLILRNFRFSCWRINKKILGFW